jgi:hypothetical protein
MTSFDGNGNQPLDPFSVVPDHWGPMEGALFDDMINHTDAILFDQELQSLYHEAMFNFHLTSDEIITAREQLDDYMQRTYGMDFWNEFDWQAYRTWYDRT